MHTCSSRVTIRATRALSTTTTEKDPRLHVGPKFFFSLFRPFGFCFRSYDFESAILSVGYFFQNDIRFGFAFFKGRDDPGFVGDANDSFRANEAESFILFVFVFRLRRAPALKKLEHFIATKDIVWVEQKSSTRVILGIVRREVRFRAGFNRRRQREKLKRPRDAFNFFF